jgi:TfoX/Sxy family transcriptional regulator of competence genes
MAYDENLAGRVRELLIDQTKVEEKKMFRGLCFMVNGKMCVNISGQELMCRIGPEAQAIAVHLDGVRACIMRGKTMTSFVYVDQTILTTSKRLKKWVDLSLAFNTEAKASPKKTKKKPRKQL